MFAVRIVKVEHYLAAPVRDLDVCYSDFRNCQLSQVPVVRIFGCTPAGRKLKFNFFFCFLYYHILLRLRCTYFIVFIFKIWMSIGINVAMHLTENLDIPNKRSSRFACLAIVPVVTGSEPDRGRWFL